MENSNNPHINEIINLSNLIPHPKNFNITKFLDKSAELKTKIIINFSRLSDGMIR
jgi:hypothetical protein